MASYLETTVAEEVHPVYGKLVVLHAAPVYLGT